ncbi:MAG: tetratricopeptide repeat protein [Bacteroidales bacterium]|nr:tetratricopeptide repeat protein [Bacteroidales bacterium]
MKSYKIPFLLIFISVLLSTYNTKAQTDDVQFYIDSISALPNDTNKVIAFNDLLWQVSSYDSVASVLIAQKSIETATKIEYYKGIGTTYKNLAKFYYYIADYQKALELYELSLSNYQLANDKQGIAISYRNLGNIHNQIGNWEQALNFFLQSLSLREEIKDTSGVALMYNAIGLLYTQVDNYEDSAYSYFNKALKTFELLSDKPKISSTYLNVGYFYYQMIYSYLELNTGSTLIDSTKFRYIDSSIVYCKKSLEISKMLEIVRYEAMAYEILGEDYSLQLEIDSAKYYFFKSLEIRQLDGNTFGVANSLLKIGAFYNRIYDYKNAEKYLDEAFTLAIEIQTDQIKAEILKELKTVYYQTGRFKEAYDAYNKYIIIKDSLENEEDIKKMTQLSMQYEFDKQDKLRELEQQKKDAIKEAQIKRQKTITTFSILGFLLMVILAVVIFRSYRQKQKTNKILEDKNEQITIKNAQLNQQNEEIEAQRDEIEKQKEFVEQQNKEITSSINYARRIQQAVITPIQFFQENFTDYFIFYKPRDIVSGDFFWGTKLSNGKLIATAADCTGHGVPGAFMSMLGISFLNQIVNQNFLNNHEDLTSAIILNQLRDMIVDALGHGAEDDDNQPQEGMDMTLVIIDKQNKSIDFAGAYNPLLHLRGDEITIHKVDRMPVGYHFVKSKNEFTSGTFEYNSNDKIYMFSDGFQDQFGGDDGRKFSPKYFRELLVEANKYSMNEQREILYKKMNDWRHTPEKEYRQIDDIIVIGLHL